jgi:hypothetical protein
VWRSASLSDELRRAVNSCHAEWLNREIAELTDWLDFLREEAATGAAQEAADEHAQAVSEMVQRVGGRRALRSAPASGWRTIAASAQPMNLPNARSLATAAAGTPACEATNRASPPNNSKCSNWWPSAPPRSASVAGEPGHVDDATPILDETVKNLITFWTNESKRFDRVDRGNNGACPCVRWPWCPGRGP